MKKIIFGFLSAFILMFSLASCSNGDNVSKRVDNPKKEVYDELDLELVKNGTDVFSYDATKSDYFRMQIASDFESSMFVYELDLDDYLSDENIKANGGSAISAVTFNVLTFSGEITVNEKTSIISAFYNESTGIKSKIYGTFDVFTAKAWTSEASLKDVKTKYDAGQKDNCLAVIYIPTYITRVKANEVVLQAFAMMPVYYELTTFDGALFDSKYLNDYPIVDLTFNQNNLLESN